MTRDAQLENFPGRYVNVLPTLGVPTILAGDIVFMGSEVLLQLELSPEPPAPPLELELPEPQVLYASRTMADSLALSELLR